MIEFNEKLPPDKDIPVMIWWTPFTLVKQTRKCNLGECFTTEDRALRNDNRTRVFLFYGTDFSASDVPLPREGKRTFKLGSTSRDLPEKVIFIGSFEIPLTN